MPALGLALGLSYGRKAASAAPPGPSNPFPSTLDGTLIARYKADEETGLSTGDNLTVATDLSANGNDLATIGGSPTWESPVVNGHAAYRGDGASDYIKGTFGANVTGGNYLIGIVRKWNSAFAAQQVLLDSSTSLGAAYYRKDTNVGNSFYNGQLIGAAASGATDVWAYVECRVNGASSTIKVNGTTVASGTLDATAVTGLTLFSAGDTAQKSDADIAEAFLINTPSVADATACKEYAMAEYGFAPPPGATANIVCEGDSHTAGTLTQPESYPAQLQGLLNSSYPNAYVVNNGTGGHTWLDLIAGEAGLTALVQVGIPNILVVECGLNDYAAGASLATIVGRMETFCADMDGIYDEIIVSTVMPAELAGADLTGTDFEDLADLYMAASVSANVTLIDQRTAAPTIGADGAQLTSTFQADHKHLSASGNVIKAEAVETAILPLLP